MTGAKDTACVLLYTLVRSYKWSESPEIGDLVDAAPVTDEQAATNVARNRLPDVAGVGYSREDDTIWLEGPPFDEVAETLWACQYPEPDIRQLFGSKQDAV
jgi:hypothetical protein